MNKQLFNYCLQLADNANILAHRLTEWCGHGPVLEQDIALSNIGLDLLGQARNLYQYAALIQNEGKTEDDLAYMRKEQEYKNVLLVEQPNIDWAYTMARQFIYDAYCHPFYAALKDSSDAQLSAIAEKSYKETTYHLRFSSEWIIRMGDGTEVSHHKIRNAFDDLWRFSEELLLPSEDETLLYWDKIAIDLSSLRPLFEKTIKDVLQEATLPLPEPATWMMSGGKQGKHTEHLGYILAEMQYMQRTYPGLEW